jgi:hypothetical protein
MTEKYTRLLVTKLSASVHEKLKELAKKDRRTLSAFSRIIIEDYIVALNNQKKIQSTNTERKEEIHE